MAAISIHIESLAQTHTGQSVPCMIPSLARSPKPPTSIMNKDMPCIIEASFLNLSDLLLTTTK